MTIEERINELGEKYEKQKEINKELVDENEALKFAARMSEKTEKQLRAEIEEFKETNHELAELAIERKKEIDELEKCRQILSDCTDRQRKENEELKHNKKTVVHLADCLEEKMKERIEELETRCTELFLQNNEFAEHLTKATEIIKGLLSCCRNYPQENAEKVEQAEQFLKEIEK